MIFEGILLVLLLNCLYQSLCVYGYFKIPLWILNKKCKYSMRRIKYNLEPRDINDLMIVAYNSVGTIPNNPFFKNKNLDNKIALIIYDNDIPIAFNVMFDYYLKTDEPKNNTYQLFSKLESYNKCLHLGLVLVDKKYQKMGLQMYTKINVILYLIENIFRTIYISDLGRSASGLKKFNNSVINSYPNLIYNTTNNYIYKSIFNYMNINFKEDLQISENSIRDDDTFIIKYANMRDGGGADYLVEHNNTTKSKDDLYNKYIENNLDRNDEVLSIGSICIFNIIVNKIKKYLVIKMNEYSIDKIYR
jgi:hypothetical protein